VVQLNKERIYGKNIKFIWYGPFEVVEKVGDNSYRLILPPYMHIYLVVNVENLKLYEPSMLDQKEEKILPSIEELETDALHRKRFCRKGLELQDRDNMTFGKLGWKDNFKDKKSGTQGRR